MHCGVMVSTADMNRNLIKLARPNCLARYFVTGITKYKQLVFGLETKIWRLCKPRLPSCFLTLSQISLIFQDCLVTIEWLIHYEFDHLKTPKLSVPICSCFTFCLFILHLYSSSHMVQMILIYLITLVWKYSNISP